MVLKVDVQSRHPEVAAVGAAWAHALSRASVQVAEPADGPPSDPATRRGLWEVGIDVGRIGWGSREDVGWVIDLDAMLGEGRTPHGQALRDVLEHTVHDALAARGLQFDPAPLASDFALDPDMVFVNNGSFGATPRDVLRVQRGFMEELEAQPIRFMLDVSSRLRTAAGRVAEFLGADPEGTVFVDNATSGVNTVLASIDWQPGDVVLATTHLYQAVHWSLKYLADRYGVRLVLVELPFPVEGPEQIRAAVEAAWPEGVKLAVFDHITSATGLVHPVAELVHMAKDRGVPVLVDGAHAPGQVPVDLGALGADYWVGNCHKWLYAPKSCAVLSVAEEHRSRVHPLVISHGYGESFTSEFDFVGTRDYSAWLAVEASLDYVAKLGGPHRVRAHNTRLRRDGTAMIADRLGLVRGAPESMLAAMETRPLPACEGRNPLDLSRRLWENHRVEAMIVAIHDTLHLRTSAQLFNSMSDFEGLADAVREELSHESV